MLHIAICDDDKKLQKQIYEASLKLIFSYDEAEYTYYSSGTDLIQAIDAGKFVCDLLFLDIHMEGADGLATAKYIRNHRLDVDIIFVTVSAEHVFDGYTCNAFSYILKPIEARRFEDELGRYLRERFTTARCLHVTVQKRKEQIFLDKVYYFEGDARRIHVRQQGGEELAFYAKLSDLEEVLRSEDFIRCHQSFLINLRMVTGYSRSEVTIGNESIPVSRKYQQQVWQRLQQDG